MSILSLPNLLIFLPCIATVLLALYSVSLFIQKKRLEENSVSQNQFKTVSIHEKIAQSVLENLSDGIVMIDKNFAIPFINQAAKRMLRVRSSDVTIKNIVNGLPPTLDLEKLILKCLTENKSLEEKGIKVDEKTFTLNFLPILLQPEENPTLMSLIIKDVTFDNSLTQVKDDFVNMMIHELRAPVVSVRGAAEMLFSQQNSLSKEDSLKMIGLIRNQSKDLLDQISSLLDLAKIQVSRFTIQKNPSDIKKLINQVIDIFQVQARNKKITLSSAIDKTIPSEISIDPIRIGQVLNNLVSNSIKYTSEKGSVKITARLLPDTPQKLFVSVEDTGIGIPKEKQKNIFTKFYQVAEGKNAGDASQTVVSGTGLGLFITKKIVDAHSGTINLESKEGKGTTISFTIPIS